MLGPGLEAVLFGRFPGSITQEKFMHDVAGDAYERRKSPRLDTKVIFVTCRDDADHSLAEDIGHIWADFFNGGALQGQPNSGFTSYGAGIHHTPGADAEVYVLVLPHIGLSQEGFFGFLDRPDVGLTGDCGAQTKAIRWILDNYDRSDITDSVARMVDEHAIKVLSGASYDFGGYCGNDAEYECLLAVLLQHGVQIINAYNQAYNAELLRDGDSGTADIRGMEAAMLLGLEVSYDRGIGGARALVYELKDQGELHHRVNLYGGVLINTVGPNDYVHLRDHEVILPSGK